MAKNSAQARRASKSRDNSESASPQLIVSPAILNGVERPVTTAQLAAAAAMLQTNAVHITLSLPCGEQKKQNPAS